MDKNSSRASEGRLELLGHILGLERKMYNTLVLSIAGAHRGDDLVDASSLSEDDDSKKAAAFCSSISPPIFARSK